MLGPHNAAVNTQRPLGPARIKWRLLAARGYRVIVINTWQWQNLPKRGQISQGAQKTDRGISELTNQKSESGNEGVDLSEGPAGQRVRASEEQMSFLQSRIMAAGAAAGAAVAAQQQQQQQQGSGDTPDSGDGQVQVGSSSSSLSALQRPIRRPGSWR